MKRVALDRITGNRPGAPRAIGAAMVAGGAVALVTYRLLRG